MPRDFIFPPIEPYSTGMLQVDGRHRLYWEQCGNPEGQPVVFLHGGPGAGAAPVHRRFFDPRRYRVVIFDQRGAGRSRPIGETRDNTTGHLIEDIEALRDFLGVRAWHVFGGSWGATLALAYAQRYPDRALSLTLRGIFLMTRAEIDWFLFGMGKIFPEAHRRFMNFLTADEREDPLEAYYRRVQDPDPGIHQPAAQSWSGYESACSTLVPNNAGLVGADAHALALARLETHYFRNNLFAPEDALLRGLDAIRHIPATIVQGRYDIVCPIETADRLAQAWPEAAYRIIPDAGHSAMEPGTLRALVDVMDTLAGRTPA
jgi:proline iminopeptidase